MAKTRLQRDTEATPQQAFVEMTELEQEDPVTGAIATVVVTAPPDDGTAEVALQAQGIGAGGSVIATAESDSGAALVQNSASSTTGSADARLEADAAAGTASARVAAVSPGGATVLVGITATAEAGVAASLNIVDGNGLAGSDASPDAVLTQDATVGSKWAVIPDPLTSAGAIVISAGSDQTILTLNADGSSSLAIDGYGEVLTVGLDGTVTLNPVNFIIPFMPTVDPVIAGALWNNNGVVMVSAG